MNAIFFFLENMKDSGVVYWERAEAYLCAFNLKTPSEKKICVVTLKNPKEMCGERYPVARPLKLLLGQIRFLS